MENPDGEALVELDDVHKTYYLGSVAVEVLRGVNLDLRRGDFVALLGPSGSGKTTLMNLIGGLDVPTRGSIRVAGNEISTASEAELTAYRRDQIGFVFQMINLVPTLTALENVELIAELVGTQDHARSLLARVGLADRADHFPSELSGGEQQRVAIARALAKRPRLLLADEPTGNLDEQTGIQVLGVIRKINRDDGLTVLMVTHNSAVAPMADVVVRLGGGRIVSEQRNPSPVPAEQLHW